MKLKMNTGSILSIAGTIIVTIVNQVVSQRNQDRMIKEVAKQISDELIADQKITTFRP